ncbi:MAG: hypothetical protein ABJ000_08720 [Saccharospirillum sp.]|uniref:hypothetical protein n=1 Tax=Saccharospirillum sp. TaxID=2033801 RepID=UPI00329958C5
MKSFLTLGFTALVTLFAASLAFSETDAEQRHPDVIDVSVSATGDNRFTFQVTLSSPYDTPQRYADAFRVMTDEGDTLGVRELLHDHASEQPFTRSLSGVSIAPGINRVIVQGRDQEFGYGGQTMTVSLPGR